MTTNIINVTCDDKTYQIPLGTTLLELQEFLPSQTPLPIAAIVNSELQELTYPLYVDSKVRWLNYTNYYGSLIYKRSINFLLYMVTQDLYPNYKLSIMHSLDKGIYCEIIGEPALGEKDFAAIEKKMRYLVEEDWPFEKKQISKDDAVAFYQSQGKPHKACLMRQRNSNHCTFYTCKGHSEYFFGPMVPATGYLGNFRIIPFDKGFVLRLPSKNDVGFQAGEFLEPRRLQAILKERANWLTLMGIETLSDLNQWVKEGRLKELILIAESAQQKHLSQIAESIAADYPKAKLVLMAGPSSSGKTTFTQRLAIEFMSLGLKPLAISMDNYFLNQADTPKDENGERDFESIYAMDLSLFNEHLQKLLAGEEVDLPKYDFMHGKRSSITTPCKMQEGNILLIEGIHGINPLLTESIPAANKRKIYISCLAQLNIDAYNPISSSDNRELRRMARDMQFRGTSPSATIARWPSVRKGEEKNIFPYQENADFYFNTALIYELPILRPLIEEELKKIDPNDPGILEARRLLSFLQYFVPAKADYIPLDSILREFLGGGCFNVNQ